MISWMFYKHNHHHPSSNSRDHHYHIAAFDITSVSISVSFSFSFSSFSHQPFSVLRVLVNLQRSQLIVVQRKNQTIHYLDKSPGKSVLTNLLSALLFKDQHNRLLHWMWPYPQYVGNVTLSFQEMRDTRFSSSLPNLDRCPSRHTSQVFCPKNSSIPKLIFHYFQLVTNTL